MLCTLHKVTCCFLASILQTYISKAQAMLIHWSTSFISNNDTKQKQLHIISDLTKSKEEHFAVQLSHQTPCFKNWTTPSPSFCFLNNQQIWLFENCPYLVFYFLAIDCELSYCMTMTNMPSCILQFIMNLACKKTFLSVKIIFS